MTDVKTSNVEIDMQTQVPTPASASTAQASEVPLELPLLEQIKAPFNKAWWTPENIAFVRTEVFLGIIICFAQIPESVAFAYLANVEPPVALHAAWIVGFICSVFGGRPGMVNGATGAFAAIIKTFVDKLKEKDDSDYELRDITLPARESGVVYLFPSVIFAGFLMLVVWRMKWFKFITLVPTTVMIGFCNGLAIVIGWAQLHPFEEKEIRIDADGHEHEHHGFVKGATLWWMLLIMLSSMATMEFMPKLPDKYFSYLKCLPSSLCSIIVAVVLEFGLIRNVGDKTKCISDVSEFTKDTAFPEPFFTNKLYDMDDLKLDGAGISKIVVQGFLLCAVGVIESLMTQEVVNTLTHSVGDPGKTVAAMGAANMISGFLGGMGGNAMIGLSTINGLNGGRGRLSPIVTALGIMVCVMGAYEVLNYIPVAALAGIMLVVVMHTFKWFSLKMLVACFLPQKQRIALGLHVKVNRMDMVVIFAVTFITVVTNLAFAVLAGVIISALQFAWMSGEKVEVHELERSKDKLVYAVEGPLFFGSRMPFEKKFDYSSPGARQVEIVLNKAEVYDYSGLAALDVVGKKFAEQGKVVQFKNMNLGAAKMYIKSHGLSENISIDGLEASDLQSMPPWYATWQQEDQQRQVALRKEVLAEPEQQTAATNGTNGV